MEGLNAVDTVFWSLGLTTPIKRFMFGVGITETLIFMSYPRWAFDEDGNMRPWSYLSTAENTTNIPWWLPGIAVGSAFALFI